MKDILQDVISHIDGLKGITVVKVVGSDTETKFFSRPEDRSVIVQAKAKEVLADFKGEFGISNLGKLKTILNLEEYAENSEFKIVTSVLPNETDPVPVALHFETKDKDFVNNFRLMAKTTIDKAYPSENLTLKKINWDFEFIPNIASIQRLKRQSAVNNDETTFRMVTDNGALKIIFGDASTDSGNFVFQNNINHKIAGDWRWPAEHINVILGLVGDKKIYFSEKGLLKICVDSGLIEYDFLIPGQKK